MIEVEKKEHESNESLMRRFSRKVQSTGMFKRNKKRQFREKQPTRTQRRESAIRRERVRKEDEYLIRIGKKEVVTKFGKPGAKNTKQKKS